MQYSEAKRTNTKRVSNNNVTGRSDPDFLNSPTSRRKGQQNGVLGTLFYYRETNHKISFSASFLTETTSRIPKITIDNCRLSYQLQNQHKQIINKNSIHIILSSKHEKKYKTQTRANFILLKVLGVRIMTAFQKGDNVPEIASKISNNIWVFTVFHHNNFLLYNCKVFTQN